MSQSSGGVYELHILWVLWKLGVVLFRGTHPIAARKFSSKSLLNFGQLSPQLVPEIEDIAYVRRSFSSCASTAPSKTIFIIPWEKRVIFRCCLLDGCKSQQRIFTMAQYVDSVSGFGFGVGRQALFDALFGRAELCDGVEFLEGNLVAKWLWTQETCYLVTGDQWKWSM